LHRVAELGHVGEEKAGGQRLLLGARWPGVEVLVHQPSERVHRRGHHVGRARCSSGVAGCGTRASRSSQHDKDQRDAPLHAGDATILATMSSKQIAWTALDKGTVVVSSDGEEIGKVSEVVADPQKDIFSGIVITPGLLEGNLFVPAAAVDAITTEAVKLSLTEAEAQSELDKPD
jgi:sporulation protein YlmC with PRC-barrel domain